MINMNMNLQPTGHILTNGWSKKMHETEIIKFQAELRETANQKMTEEMMIYHFAKELTDAIISNKSIIQISKSHNPLDIGYVWKAQINIAGSRCHGGVVNTDSYQVDGHEISHEKIQHAVRNSFPELYL